jgi:hypothetical protein
VDRQQPAEKFVVAGYRMKPGEPYGNEPDRAAARTQVVRILKGKLGDRERDWRQWFRSKDREAHAYAIGEGMDAAADRACTGGSST